MWDTIRIKRYFFTFFPICNNLVIQNLDKIILKYIFQLLELLNMMYVQYRSINYRDDRTIYKEVSAMEGITKIDIPEIKGLQETFAESTVDCGRQGTNQPTCCS